MCGQAVDTDPVLAELKKLREGRGLTMDRLKDSRAVLNALDTANAREGYRMLQLAVRELGDDQKVRALIVDFGWGLENCLGRPPLEDEIQWLGRRRSAYAELVGRDIKTVTRWSNKALEELNGLIGSERFTGHVVITAGVRQRRVVVIGVMRYQSEGDLYSQGDDQHYTNPEPGPSPPLLLYGFPRDWQPAAIHFAVQFLDHDHPSKVWALVIDNIFHVGFGTERIELEVSDDGLARYIVESPSVDQLYGVWWEW